MFIPVKISFDDGMYTDSLITQLYHGLEAILHYGQVDVDSSLQNRTFERKIGPFSDQFAPKSPIADQSPRKSDLVGTLHMLT